MKWFEHPSNFRDMTEFKDLLRHAGIVGYGCALIVFEVLAEHQPEKSTAFELSLDDKRYGLAFWRRELRLNNSSGAAMQILITLASCGVIDEDALLQRRVVAAPMLQNLLDDWSKRKKK
jgi:hypothetical protein